jgi:hypothetical protein
VAWKGGADIERRMTARTSDLTIIYCVVGFEAVVAVIMK